MRVLRPHHRFAVLRPNPPTRSSTALPLDPTGGLPPTPNQSSLLHNSGPATVHTACGPTESKESKTSYCVLDEVSVSNRETLALILPALTCGTPLGSVHSGVYRERPAPTTQAAWSYRSVDHPPRIQLARRHDRIRDAILSYSTIRRERR